MQNNHRAVTAVGCAAVVGILGTLASCGAPNGVQKPPQETGWVAERELRMQRQADYLNDTTVKRVKTDAPDRAPWYNNRLGYTWFKDSPLGVNGVPYVLLRAVIEVFPEIWKGEGSLGNLGFGPHPDDYDPITGKLRPADQRHPLPYGLVTAEDLFVHENQRTGTENVFFSCGTCHTGRVYVKDRVRHYVGAPNTEVEMQAYAGRILATGKALIKVDSPDPSKIQPDTAQIMKIADFLKTKVETDPAWFYGGRSPEERAAGAERAKTQVARVLDKLPAIVGTSLIGAAKRTELMYLGLAQKLSYVEKDGQKPPGLFGPRPGRMDAFGISPTLVSLHARAAVARPEGKSFFSRLPDNHPFFQGLEQLPPLERVKQAALRLIETEGEWLPHEPGASDIKALWYSRDHVLANWDANQGAEARVIASGVSSVGDPAKVDVKIHESMNPFINELPPPPYPFAVDLKVAEAGKPLFVDKCVSCHKHNISRIYSVGTDMNRARQISPEARLGLLELTREACKLYIERGGSDWCLPKLGSRVKDDEDYFITPRKKPGYKADVLHGIWAHAPYLHNGSVPTLWHLLRPKERPAKFVRGNIKYDEVNVGFVWDRAPALDEYGTGDSVHWAEHDTTLRGNSNAGHTYGGEWTDEQVRAVIEYMKML
jgi:hypothetical protein